MVSQLHFHAPGTTCLTHRGRTIRLTDCIPRISPQPLWCVLASHRHSANSSARSQPVRIEDCDVRRGRTSPPGHCGQTPVTWGRAQCSTTKYVLVPSAAPTPGISPPAEGPHPSNGPSNKPGMPRTHHRARGLHPGSVLSSEGAFSRLARSHVAAALLRRSAACLLRDSVFGCVMAAGIMRGQVAGIHLRTTI